MIEEKQVAEGNAQVKELLKYWTEEVEKGLINYMALACSSGPTAIYTGRAGVGGMQMGINYGLDLLKRHMMDELQNRINEPPSKDAPADRVMYNVAKMPCSFDFAIWLLGREVERIREGAPPPLKVGWFFGKQGDPSDAFQSERRRKNFDNILRPLVGLIGAVEDATAIDGRVSEVLSIAPLIKAHEEGIPLPRFIVPEQAKTDIMDVVMKEFGRVPVTITLREATYTPHRNSNMTEWLKFAEWLEKHGEKVIFVRDTERANEPIQGFAICPPASLHLPVRAALYAVAKANLFVSNGPAVFAYFGDRPYLIFNQPREGIDWASTAEGIAYFTGIKAGEQYPFAKPDQRLVWAMDTFETIKEAWLTYMEKDDAKQDSQAA